MIIRNVIKIYILSVILVSTLCFAEEGFSLLTTISGEAEGDMFREISAGGDVNGDGYNDFIVGAAGGNYAKLYFGGPDFDTIPDLTFKEAEKLFSYHPVSIIGDLNGDGFDDVVIGAPIEGDSEEGKAHLMGGG